jgi:hypothetical protein
MLGQLSASSVTSDNRIFVYEVTGLRQSDQSDQNCYPFRSSSNVFIQVPVSRMNDQMRRITMMGGTIVGIRPLTQAEQR